MIEILENDNLLIGVSSAGAELTSIYHKKRKQEFLWQGSAQWWPRRAPVLFPIVGKLNKNLFHVNGNGYSLPQHGFARDSEFELLSRTSDRLSFVLRSTPDTQMKYPFDFELVITYQLSEKSVTTMYEVKNTGGAMLSFSIGAHPGFALQPGEQLSDYFIELERPETLQRHLITDGLLNGTTELVTDQAVAFDLTDEQMKKDAIVFKNMKSQTLILKSRKSDYSLKFFAPDFPYFGIWAKPGGPFVCLEPWCGLADKSGFDGELNEKEGIEKLAAGMVFTRQFTVTPVYASRTAEN